MVDGLPGEIMELARIVSKLELEHALALHHQEEEPAAPVLLLIQHHARVSDDRIVDQKLLIS